MRKFAALCRQSLRAILANKGRSFLTVLGIIIGIGSVIALVSLGNGAKAVASQQINDLGATNLTVIPGGGFSTSTSAKSRSSMGRSLSSLTQDDLDALRKQGSFNYVAGMSGSPIIVNAGGNERIVTVSGVTNDYFPMYKLSIDKGTMFTDAQQTKPSKVAILGNQLASDLGTSTAVGKTITIGNQKFEVIGSLAAATSTQFTDPNTQIYIPLKAAFDLFGTKHLSSIMVQASNTDAVDQAKTDIQNTLLESHSIKDPKAADFTVISPKDLLAAVGQITGVLTSLLASIAGISLVVGGIGIMNIMLVSVTERTREIGLRKAVGATTGDIMVQFLVEALILTIIGGILGILVGYLIGASVGPYLNLKPVVDMSSVILAVGVSTAVGLVFGIYPAHKAAQLNPIDALRYE